MVDAVCDDDKPKPRRRKVVEDLEETVLPALKTKATTVRKTGTKKSKASTSSPSPVKTSKKVNKRVKKQPTVQGEVKRFNLHSLCSL